MVRFPPQNSPVKPCEMQCYTRFRLLHIRFHMFFLAGCQALQQRAFYLSQQLPDLSLIENAFSMDDVKSISIVRRWSGGILYKNLDDLRGYNW